MMFQGLLKTVYNSTMIYQIQRFFRYHYAYVLLALLNLRKPQTQNKYNIIITNGDNGKITARVSVNNTKVTLRGRGSFLSP